MKSMPFLLTLVLAAGTGCQFFSTSLKTESVAMTAVAGREPRGLYRFAFDDFQSLNDKTLERSAFAWKVIAAAMLNHHRQSDPTIPVSEAGYSLILTRHYGFVTPSLVANWPASAPQPRWDRPAGLVHGTLSRRMPTVELEVSNHGCATCHAGVLYDADGNPTREVWMGLPSTSINLGRYADDAYVALARAADRPDELLATVKAAFPSVSKAELSTIRNMYLPRLRKRIVELRATVNRFTPYSNGGPGLTNGVATLKLYLGAIDGNHPAPGEVAFTSVPDLAGLRLRTSILWDGIYAPPGWSHTGFLPSTLDEQAHRDGIGQIVSAVTVPTLGVSPGVAATNVPRVREAVAWMFDGYEPPPFPGRLDAALAATGAEKYEQFCAGCHGSYEETARGPRLRRYPNKIVPAEVIGTDRARMAGIGTEPNRAFGPTALGPYLDARSTGGYIAAPLTSLWATAPYLHNGSVPTLWHLMHPEARPVQFEVGGHRLDFEKVGIDGATGSDGVHRYPAGYQPWVVPEIYDTRLPGRSSRGHNTPFNQMNDQDKRAVLEFLKRV